MRTIHLRLPKCSYSYQVYIKDSRFKIKIIYPRLPANMLRILTSILFLYLFFSTMLMEVTPHARVSKNGQLVRNSHNFFSWITRSERNNTKVERERERDNENRNIYDFTTVSPVYVPPRIPKLRKEEAVNRPIASRYSTLDHEIIAKLDTTPVKKRIQQRFHPPAVFETSVTHSNLRPEKEISTLNIEHSPDVNSSVFSGPILSGVYEYSLPEYLDDESLMSKPIMNKYPSVSTTDKIPDSYKPSPNKYHEYETDYPNLSIASSYENDVSRLKPMKFVNHHNHPFLSVEDPYEHDHDDFHHEVTYDYIPEYHEHQLTTEEPEVNDQRLDKRPYSYYFIGKKLWYIPLYFSIYFIIYIAALVLKSIARHKINFPAQLAEVATHDKRSSGEGWRNSAEKILERMERFAEISSKSSAYRVNYH